MPGEWGRGAVIQRLPFSGLLGYLLNAPAVRAAFKSWQGDILHAHYAGGYGLCASLTLLRPRIVSVWGADVYDVPQQGRVWKAIIRQVLNRADRVTSTSYAMREQCRTLNVIREIDVVAFGIDTEIFRPSDQKNSRENQPLIVGTVKTMHEKYGIDTLIHAFAHIGPRVDHCDIRLKIVGGGPELDNLRRLCTELKISDFVEFLGHVDYEHVPENLQSLDIYCAPSRWDSESFGVAIIEASACALPVIVSDVGGLPEVVDNGETGLVISRDDVAGLADAIKRLIKDDALRRSMGEKGRANVIRKYEWSRCIDQMIEIYRSVIALQAR